MERQFVESINHEYTEDKIVTRFIKNDGTIYRIQKYNIKGQPIKSENNGIITTYEYDEHDNVICQRHSDGRVQYMEYNSDNKLIHMKEVSSLEYEAWYEYDDKNLIYYYDTNDFSIRYRYDENNNMIQSTNSLGFVYDFEYNENGNIISSLTSNGVFENWSYDDKGNVIHYQNKDINEWYRYDDNNNMFHIHDIKNNIEYMIMNMYDSENRLIKASKYKILRGKDVM